MRVAVIALVFILAGCSGQILHSTFPPTAATEIIISETLYQGTLRIGSVSGKSCDTGVLTRINGTREKALENAKVEAAKLGAIGIAQVRTSQVKSVFDCRGLGGLKVTAVAFRQ